ncbi:MAG: VRR-NUC domain-containing protein [Bacteroidota bacterium]
MEAIEQIKVVNWVKQQTDLPCFHFAGERKCNPIYGSVLKSMGVTAGVADLFFMRSDKNKEYKGLWLELKVGKNRLTDAQKDFLVIAKREGYQAEVIYGSEKAISYIKAFYSLEE